MRNRSKILSFSTVLLAVGTAAAATVEPEPVIRAMEQELSRTMSALRDQPRPPYFLSYEITDLHSANVSASFGALTSSSEDRVRLLDVDLRVGDYEFDNTHPIRGDRFGGFPDFSVVEIPIDDDPAAIRSTIWYHTDRKYKRALEQYTKARTNVKVKVEEEDKSADLSREEPETYFEKPQRLEVDLEAWQKKVERYTRPFAAHANIYGAESTLVASRQTRWFVSTEGARLQTSRLAYRLMLSAFTKADDGMELPRVETFFSYSPDGLPGDEEVLATVERMIEDLRELRVAPVVEPYTGPAILSGRAAGVFFHEIFGHRLEAYRHRSDDDAQTFKKMVDEQVLPTRFSVTFDPTRRRLADTDLAGSYRYDNQGVKARPVQAVDAGVLREFLLSRRPVEGFAKSNGHGRRQPGFAAVSRQSNLIVGVEEAVSPAELKKMLIERVQEEDKPFGLIFDDIMGGFTTTGRMMPNAFNVIPVMVYRVFPDGREELVRGVDLIGTPLTAFSMLVAGDDRVAVFNGTCGAESGGVPVSAASPSLLVSQIEVQKKEKSPERPPLLPAPFDSDRPGGE